MSGFCSSYVEWWMLIEVPDITSEIKIIDFGLADTMERIDSGRKAVKVERGGLGGAQEEGGEK